MKQGLPVALFGDSMAGKSAVVTVQRRLNAYFENRPDGDKTRIACFGRPGLKAAFRLQSNAVMLTATLTAGTEFDTVGYVQNGSVGTLSPTTDINNNAIIALFTSSFGVTLQVQAVVTRSYFTDLYINGQTFSAASAFFSVIGGTSTEWVWSGRSMNLTSGMSYPVQISGPLSAVTSAPRAFFGTQDALYACVDDLFLQVNPGDGSTLFTGPLATDQGYCEIATNETTQTVVVDGSAGYLYQNGAFTRLSEPFPAGATSITYCSDFFIVNVPGTQQFYQSNANDGSTWNGLQVAAASAYSDLLLAVDNLMGNLALFCQQHVEFWQDVGTSPVAFQPILSAVSMFGLAALASRSKVADSICFLGQNREGQIQVCQARGFGVKPISTPDLDYRLNRLKTVSDAVGLTYGIDAHKFYVLTFPTENISFQWDAITGLWGDVQSGVSTVQNRLNAQYGAYYGGKVYLTDPQTNQIYTMDPLSYTDDGEAFAIELVTRHVNSNFDRLWPAQLYLDMETGVGLQTGQGADPQIMLQYSKDNGRTWSAERWRSLGKIGKYKARVLWRRFGCTRDATWKIRMTDPVKFVIAIAALKMRVRQGTPARRAA